MSGLIAISVALIGSIGAGLVYLWQKAEDRRERYRSEKQEVYKEYLRSMRRIVSSAISAKSHDDAEASQRLQTSLTDHDALVDLMELYASEQTRQLLVPLEQALFDWRSAFEASTDNDLSQSEYQTYFSFRLKVVSAMREELFSGMDKSPFRAFRHWMLKKPFSIQPPE